MASRRDVLKLMAGTFLASAGGSVLTSCGGLKTFRAGITNATIVVPKVEAPQLAQPNGILLVYATGLSTPIILRSVENQGIVALSSECTHSGCEVRPFPDSFECPCHGSEYSITGEVLEGPASESLKRFPVEETSCAWIIRIS